MPRKKKQTPLTEEESQAIVDDLLAGIQEKWDEAREFDSWLHAHITDSTLRKIADQHRPVDDIAPFPTCSGGGKYPCELLEFIREDLERRIATDPITARSLSEGAL